jgi:hypothetical protein
VDTNEQSNFVDTIAKKSNFIASSTVFAISPFARTTS